MNIALLLITLLGIISCQTQEKVSTEGNANQNRQAMDHADSEKFDPQSLVGKSLEEARKTCETRNLPHRVIKIDGQSQVVTRDFRMERLNFTVEKGIVTAVTMG